MSNISTGLPPLVRDARRDPQRRQTVAGLANRKDEPTPRESENTRLRHEQMSLASGVQRQPYFDVP
jgi:hypothetical protein